MELIDLVPNSLTFRIVHTVNLHDHDEVPPGMTGRVRRWAGTHLLYVAWYRAGALHDPSRTTAAYRRHRPSGAVRYDMHYTAGRLQDPASGSAAVRGFYADGRVHYEEHFRGGVRHDGVNGEAALMKWRQDGSLRHALHYRAGVRVESPDDAVASSTDRHL